MYTQFYMLSGPPPPPLFACNTQWKCIGGLTPPPPPRCVRTKLKAPNCYLNTKYMLWVPVIQDAFLGLDNQIPNSPPPPPSPPPSFSPPPPPPLSFLRFCSMLPQFIFVTRKLGKCYMLPSYLRQCGANM